MPKIRQAEKALLSYQKNVAGIYLVPKVGKIPFGYRPIPTIVAMEFYNPAIRIQ